MEMQRFHGAAPKGAKVERLAMSYLLKLGYRYIGVHYTIFPILENIFPTRV